MVTLANIRPLFFAAVFTLLAVSLASAGNYGGRGYGLGAYGIGAAGFDGGSPSGGPGPSPSTNETVAENQTNQTIGQPEQPETPTTGAGSQVPPQGGQQPPAGQVKQQTYQATVDQISNAVSKNPGAAVAVIVVVVLVLFWLLRSRIKL